VQRGTGPEATGPALFAVTDFECALILKRRRERIAIAKAEGKYRGRKRTLSAARVRELVNRATAGQDSKTALAREYGVSRETLYQYLKADTHHGQRRRRYGTPSEDGGAMVLAVLVFWGAKG
jgi:DNA invertase Pin-like site-specific DNA recombinase